MAQILVIRFRNVKWRDTVREHLAQASVRRGCAVRVWGIHGCSWNTSCTYGMSFQTCFTVYIAPFLLGKFAFVGEKKKTTFSIIIALWTITGQVLLACLGYLAVSPGIAQICYQELGYTIANGNSVSPWLCNEFSFSSNWKLSCEQTWQGTGHSRQVFKRSFKKYFSFCRKTRLHPRGKNVV